MNIQAIALYSILAGFMTFAFVTAPPPESISGGMVFLKYAIYATLFAFVVFTVYCTIKENFFKSIRKIVALHWGRQVGVDLYIGLLLQMFLVFMVEKSVAMMIVWLIPALIYGNIIPLLYFATHFERIVTVLGMNGL